MRHGRMHRISNSTSTNWSGYAVTGSRFTQVSASWTEPTVKCSGTAYSSFWVGLDGDTSGTVEQTGTDADCSGSTPQYYAWYEMYPKFPVNLSGTVRPGDKLSASVTTNGSGSFTLKLTDSTQGWTNTTTARLKSAKLASAEVIAEAPSGSGGVLPLANFGTVSFSGATANGKVLTSSTPNIDPITMASGSTVKAQPSSISNGAFSVTWKHS
ncbi:MAG TPA: G1 family glutamic endopeptidase [Gaiellaceae bacterium]|nr:G1 family glutamic endopeptidase [Gaiellaceae bacterium]